MKRILAAIFIFFFALILVAVIVSYRTFRKSLPKTKGRVEIQALAHSVQIYRDDNGIPHIYADNDHDLYFAMGYVIAQDRLWQLELIRRVVNGRLSEILGDTTIAADRFLLTIGFKRIGGVLYKQISETSKKIVQAYTDGINYFIQTHQGKYPIEFMLLNARPQLWHPEDCLGFSRLMAWELSYNWYTEFLAAKIKAHLGDREARELFADSWGNWPLITAENLDGFQFDRVQRITRQLAGLTGLRTWPQGSNNWVIDGTRAESGRPILANDPHLLLSNPSRWYMVHLNAPGVNVAGFTLPGSPGVVIGFNQHVAWGLTNVMADDADFFVEHLNPADSSLYWLDGEWKRMKTITETILVKGKDPVRFSVYLTEHGPLVNQVHPHIKGSPVRVALRWTGQEITDEPLAFYRMNRAQNREEFEQGVREFKVPNQNIVYCDVEGNIAYWCAGLIPVRAGTTKIFPQRSGRNWIGFVPFEQLPHRINPEIGFLATANNRVASAGYPYYISNQWEPPSRIMRIRELLQQDKKFTVDDFKEMQMDTYSKLAEYLMPKILPELEKLADQETRFAGIYRFMQGWDFFVRGESVAASIFHVFLGHFLENTFKDELGEADYQEYLRFSGLPLRMVRKLFDLKLEHWFDDVHTKTVRESAADIIRKSWRDAADELQNRLGSDLIKWRWDRIHRVTFRHFLGGQPMLRRLFNVGPLPMSGSHTTINNGNYSLQDPYDCIVGPSMRMIVDMAHPGRAEVINPPGQVGHPLSNHYHDLVDFWLNGLYISLETDSTTIKNSNYDLLELVIPEE